MQGGRSRRHRNPQSMESRDPISPSGCLRTISPPVLRSDLGAWRCRVPSAPNHSLRSRAPSSGEAPAAARRLPKKSGGQLTKTSPTANDASKATTCKAGPTRCDMWHDVYGGRWDPKRRYAGPTLPNEEMTPGTRGQRECLSWSRGMLNWAVDKELLLRQPDTRDSTGAIGHQMERGGDSGHLVDMKRPVPLPRMCSLHAMPLPFFAFAYFAVGITTLSTKLHPQRRQCPITSALRAPSSELRLRCHILRARRPRSQPRTG